MGVRTRGLDIKVGAKCAADDRVARADAKAVIERWNEQLAAGRDMLWSPTIRAAMLAGMARCVLPGLPDEPRHRSRDYRSSPASLGRPAGARATVLMVSGVGTDAEAESGCSRCHRHGERRPHEEKSPSIKAGARAAGPWGGGGCSAVR
jgi:hypothetical protein